jgi:LPS export ABC transporter permease LptG/LPS export ABC transporter permease LptF
VSFIRTLRPTLLDRYVIRETLPPTGIGFLLFTFILVLDQISQLTKLLVSQGADFPTVVRAFVYLLPSIFSVTIPMAFLLGVLLAFGRMASDSEIVALRASGVSPARLLRPVTALACLACAVTFYVVAIALPGANQAYRELIFNLVVSKARTGIAPRVFNDELLPSRDLVIYISDIRAESGEWREVFIHDGRRPQQPAVILARRGHLEIDKARKTIEIRLQDGVVHVFDAMNSAAYERIQFQSRNIPLPFAQLYSVAPLSKGDREMRIYELRQRIQDLKAKGKGPKDTNPWAVEIHKKFAIPGACFVFGFLGLALSLGSKKEARSAAFGLSIAVIFVYYVFIRLGEQAGDTGLLHPVLAMWGANIVLGMVALLLLVLNQRAAAFDPLDASQYRALLPLVRKSRRSARASAAKPMAVRARGTRRGRRVLVIRVRRPSVSLLPGILDRYIARSYVGKFALVLVAFWSLFVLVSFMDLFDDVQVNKVKGAVVLHYYAFASPSIVQLVTPVAVLVAVLITFGVLARRNEVTAMKAAGISVYRIALPALAMGLLVSLLVFAASEYVLPPANRVAKEDFNEIKGRPRKTASLVDKRWLLGSQGQVYHYDALSGSTLYGLTVYGVSASKGLRDILYASRAVWNGVSYDLERGWRRTLEGASPGFREFPQVKTREIEAPYHFSQEEREPDTLRFEELRKHIRSLQGLGLDVTPLRVKLHSKLAFPLVSLVMTLLGIPFSFVVARRGALYGIAASIVIAIIYWACLAVFDALGNNAYLPPLLAAWAPNLLFAAAGLYLMLTLDT